MTLAQRFWSKVDPAPSQCCWEWTACTYLDGYGQFRLNNQLSPAHRVAYTLTKGEIPDGLMVRHTCDNRLCSNPSHLILGTHTDNMKDRQERKRQAKGKYNGKSKLTEEQAMEIYKSSLSIREIAKLYNICTSNISLIKLKKTWKHIHS